MPAPYAKSTAHFVQFIKDNSFTTDQVRQAYICLVGGLKDTNPSTEVLRIVKKMEEMIASDEGFPLTRFTALLRKEDFESGLGKYYRCIEKFNISAKEKSILRSIVDKRRKGELDCFMEGEIIATFRIKKDADSEETLAIELTRNFEKLNAVLRKGKTYEFRFTEN